MCQNGVARREKWRFAPVKHAGLRGAEVRGRKRSEGGGDGRDGCGGRGCVRRG